MRLTGEAEQRLAWVLTKCPPLPLSVLPALPAGPCCLCVASLSSEKGGQVLQLAQSELLASPRPRPLPALLLRGPHPSSSIDHPSCLEKHRKEASLSSRAWQTLSKESNSK